MKKKRTVASLPADVYSKLEERVKATGFKSVDEYILFILSESLKDEREEGSQVDSEVAKKEGKERLKALVLSILEQL